VLDWIFRRCDGTAGAVDTPIGLVPSSQAIDTHGLDVTREPTSKLLEVDVEDWRNELPAIEQHFARFGNRLPQALEQELHRLERRLGAA